MKDEDAFNAHLSKKMKALVPKYKSLKMSEKYHIGIPDFALWSGGRSVVIESKLVHDITTPKTPGQFMKHPFTGPQITFLNDTLRTGTPAFGLVGVDEYKEMLLIPANLIPPSGTWATAGFVSLLHSGGALIFPYARVDAMVEGAFSYYVEDMICRKL